MQRIDKVKNATFAERRHFIKTTMFGGLAAVAAPSFGRMLFGAEQAQAPAATEAAATTAAPGTGAARVALTTGDQRPDNVFRALKMCEKEIVEAIGKRRVVVKPNAVSPDRPMANIHTETLEGVMEFLKSIGKLNDAIIAESSAADTAQAMSLMNYPAFAQKYGVKLVNLDQEKYELVTVLGDEPDIRPKPVRMSSILLDSANNFIISVAKMKTHDRIVATLSLKNIIMGAPVKVPITGLGRGGRGGRGGGAGGNDKPLVHGGNGFRMINLNLSLLAPRLHPALSVIDGFEGMEGNGPANGIRVDHRVCLASTDWMAADRVGVELMGINFADLGYLTYCANAGLGVSDLQKIEVLGETVEKHRKTYRLPDSFQRQESWKQQPRLS
jgi:uncharacterized protein (DUF362 family)